jgi:hypothetical protein
MAMPGYPAPPGAKPWSSHNITGPASYTQVVTGAPLGASSGGQQVTASAFGLQYFEGVWTDSGSDDGQYYANIFLSPRGPGALPVTCIIQWIVAATGAEVAAATNLSGRTMRFRAAGL